MNPARYRKYSNSIALINVAATYVIAAADNTRATIGASACVTNPIDTSNTFARLLASNSTGRLINWKTTVIENATMPSTIKLKLCKKNPAIIKIHDRFPPHDANGTSPFRITSNG